MSWKSKTDLIQRFVSVKRPLEFVPHGNMTILDSEMHGLSRFCKKMEGDYVVLVSDTDIPTANSINIGDRYLVIDGWNVVPRGSLLSVDGKEFVVVSWTEHVRVSQDPTQKQTYLHVEKPLSRSYPTNTSLLVVGFPVSLVGTYASGAQSMLMDTALMVVPGDMIARFRYEGDGIPVLDDWQRISGILDKSEFHAESGDLLRRYYALLEKPLQRDLDPTSKVFIKAVPAYQSQIIPLGVRGSHHVDAFTGKTFGTGADDLYFYITLYDSNRNIVSAKSYSKNDVLLVSSFPASDLALWKVGAGSVDVRDDNAVLNLDSSGHLSLGKTFPKHDVSFRLRLSSVDDFTAFVSTSSGRLRHDSVEGLLVFEISEATNHIMIDIKGTPSSFIHAVTDDVRIRACYLDYSYCSSISVSDSWEGASLMLKPCFDTMSDLYADTDGLDLDSGVILP